MRVVSRRVLEMVLMGGYVRSVRRDVRLVMVELRGADAIYDDGEDVYICTWPLASVGVGKRVYLSQISCAV
jgi:hypothetical protein